MNKVRALGVAAVGTPLLFSIMGWQAGPELAWRFWAAAAMCGAAVAACTALRLRPWFSLVPGVLGLALVQAGVAAHWGVQQVVFWSGLTLDLCAGAGYWASVGWAGSLDREMKVAQIRHLGTRTETELVRAETARTRADIARLTLDTKRPEAEVVRYADPVAQRIDEAVQRVYKTPTTGVVVSRPEYGWAAQVGVPLGIGRDAFISRWDAVATGVGGAGHQVVSRDAEADKVLVRCVEVDLLREPVNYRPMDIPLHKLPWSDPLRLGTTEFGDIAELIVAGRHTLIAGSSGSGKSSLVKLLVLRLSQLADSQIIGVDLKPGAPELSMVKDLLQDVVNTEDELLALFAWLDKEATERGEIMVAAGDTNWNPLKHGRPVTYIVMDEFGAIATMTKAKQIYAEWKQLLAKLRAYGLYFIAATQQPSRGSLGGNTDMRGNFANRVCLGMDEPKHYDFMGLPRGTASVLNQPGKFIITNRENPQMTELVASRAEFVSDEVCRRAVAGLARDTVKGGPASFQKPPPAGLNNTQRVAWALRNGPLTRVEIEAATGLDEKQVLNAARAAGAARSGPGGAWRLEAHDDAA